MWSADGLESIRPKSKTQGSIDRTDKLAWDYTLLASEGTCATWEQSLG